MPPFEYLKTKNFQSKNSRSVGRENSSNEIASGYTYFAHHETFYTIQSLLIPLISYRLVPC